MDMNVRILVGAKHAYVCIKTPTTSLDVLLKPGKGASKSLRETALEMREEARQRLARADLVEQAANQLEEEGR